MMRIIASRMKAAAVRSIAFEIAGQRRNWLAQANVRIHDPALGQNFKTDGGSRTFDDLDPPSTCSRGGFRGLRPSITAVTVDALDKRETADACSA